MASEATWQQKTPAALALAAFGVLAAATVYALSRSSDAPGAWNVVGLFAAIAAVAMAVMFLAKAAVKTPASAPAGDDSMRAHIAPMIITVGTVGIAGLAIAVMSFIAFGVAADSPILQKLDTILLGVFSSVLSVFAAWVGTVLAFYFSNENFRAATESAQRLIGANPASDEPITDPVRMIPLDKIVSITLDAEHKPELLALSEVEKKFSATATRIPIFNKEGQALMIVRKKLADIVKGAGPAAAAGAPAAAPLTVADYLKHEQNAADAVNFRFLPVNATVEDGRRTLRLYNTADIFITNHGTDKEPVKGWITDERLR